MGQEKNSKLMSETLCADVSHFFGIGINRIFISLKRDYSKKSGRGLFRHDWCIKCDFIACKVDRSSNLYIKFLIKGLLWKT